jgi:hypothetical protein
VGPGHAPDRGRNVGALPYSPRTCAAFPHQHGACCRRSRRRCCGPSQLAWRIPSDRSAKCRREDAYWIDRSPGP